MKPSGGEHDLLRDDRIVDLHTRLMAARHHKRGRGIFRRPSPRGEVAILRTDLLSAFLS
jgi:hypothetical protein